MEGLIVVDVQNDFCPGGALAVRDGDAVIDPINQLAREAQFVVATRDWHPADHSSFASQGGRWPVHCVMDTPGAQLHPWLDASLIDAVLDTGYTSALDGYSGFDGTDLERLLRFHEVERVHVGGLALDYCVKATALDANAAGFAVVVHLDATRAIDASAGDAERAVAELVSAGVEVAR